MRAGGPDIFNIYNKKGFLQLLFLPYMTGNRQTASRQSCKKDLNIEVFEVQALSNSEPLAVERQSYTTRGLKVRFDKKLFCRCTMLCPCHIV